MKEINMLKKLVAKAQAYAMSKDGATAIEYGLIAGGISLAIVAAVFAFGNSLSSLFDSVSGKMNSAANGGG